MYGESESTTTKTTSEKEGERLLLDYGGPPDDRQLLVLDCRPQQEYHALHIKNSHNIPPLPAILHKRLAKGSIGVSNVIKEAEGKCALTSGNGESLSVFIVPATRASTSSPSSVPSPPIGIAGSSAAGDSVCTVIQRRLQNDGFHPIILSHDMEAFAEKYPDLCEFGGGSEVGGEGGRNGCDMSNGGSSNGERRMVGPLIGLQSLTINEPPSTSADGSSPTSTMMDFHQSSTLMIDSDSSTYGSFPPPNSTTSSSSSASSSSTTTSMTSSSDHLPPATFQPIQSYKKMNGRSAENQFPVKILPYLYLGNAENAADKSVMDKYSIRYVLNVTPNLPNSFVSDPSFHYLQIPINDHWSQNLAAHFPKAIQFIEEAEKEGSVVLVHCLAGISRSVTVTLAYLMKAVSVTLDEAYEQVKAAKPNIAPNFNFMGQLLDYERQLNAASPDSGRASCEDNDETNNINNNNNNNNNNSTNNPQNTTNHFLSPTLTTTTNPLNQSPSLPPSTSS